MRNEYRIVRDIYAGYEVQVRRWWWPLWMEIGCNTQANIEKAEEYANRHAQGSVKYLGRLPARRSD